MDRLRQAVGDAEADLLRPLVRLVARPDLRQHVPRQLPGARHRRRARPDRVDDRRAGRAAPAVLDAAAQRRRARRRRSRSSSGSATRAATPARSPTAPAPAARYAAIADALRAAPGPHPGPVDRRAFEYNYSFLIGDTLGAMYDSFGWPDFALFLAVPRSRRRARRRSARRWRRSAGRRALARTSQRAVAHGGGYVTKRGFPTYQNFIEGFPARGLRRLRQPGLLPRWCRGRHRCRRGARLLRSRSGRGSPRSAPSGRAPTRTATSVPFDTETDDPVLVVGARWDPATRYQGARHRARPAAELGAADGQLLGPHVAVPVGLRRRGDRGVPHLATTPAAGTVCTQDLVPWVDFGPGGP